jgi:hypothetical protein
MMAEMGAVWIEKFRNGGLLDTSFQFEHGGIHNAIDTDNDIMRLGASRSQQDIRELYPRKPGQENQQEGYAMAILLYYLINNYSCKDSDILELYSKYWKRKEVSSTLVSVAWWFESKNNFNFFEDTEKIDSYYLSLFKGDILKDFFRQFRLSMGDLARVINNGPGKFSVEGRVYGTGCEAMLVKIFGFKDVNISDYELVVKQGKNDVHSYLLYSGAKPTVKLAAGKATLNDSIVVSGSTFADLKNNSGEIEAYVVVLTTNNANNQYVTGYEPALTTIELRKPPLNVKPSELTFEAEGGEQTVKINTTAFKDYGGTPIDCKEWISIKRNPDYSFTVTATANTTGKERSGSIKAYGTNATNPTDENCSLQLIKVTQKAGNGGNEGNEGNEGKEGWWLVETKIDKAEDTTNDNGHFIDYMNYTASETGQSMTGMQTGLKSYEYVQQPVSFVSTIQAPPAWIGGGETLLLHFTVKRTSPAAYCYVPVGPVMYWGNAQVAKINVVGGTSVATRENDPSEGEWDFELQISKGSKNSEKEIKLVDACRSTIHWIYRWGNSSAK